MTRSSLLLLIALSTTLLPACSGGDKPTADARAAPAPKPALTVTVTTPQSAEWPRMLPANGSIAAWQEAVIGAEAAGLRIAEVLVNVGDQVKRGQPLARLQSRTVAADVAQTRAAIAEADALRAEAQANAARANQLKASGAISAQQIQQYMTAEQTARARLESLRARLQADQIKLSQTRVLAPDDGVISARIATVGSVVQPGQELFRLIREQRLEWRAEVPADQLARIEPGTRATLTPAGGDAVTGTVRMLAPTVDAATRNGIVYVDLPAGSAARAGMFARGEFSLGSTRALSLPQSAVLLRDGFAYAFQVGPDGRVAQTKVDVGRRVGDRIEIRGGLSADARVVESGAGFLADGDMVRVVDSPMKAAAAK